MKTVAVYSIKGGVGKTTTAANLAWAAAHAGQRTLLVDLDPQGASSYYYRVRPKKGAKARSMLAGGSSLRDAVRASDHEGLDILPAHLSYRHLDVLLDGMKKSKTRLRRALRDLTPDYGIMVLDAPPNITLLAENLFTVADLVLVPVIPTPLSERTWEQLKAFFAKKGYRRKKLRAFFVMAETRNRLHRDTMEALRERDPKFFLESVIPKSVDIERMAARREPVMTYAGRRAAGRACEALCAEVLAVLE